LGFFLFGLFSRGVEEVGLPGESYAHLALCWDQCKMAGRSFLETAGYPEAGRLMVIDHENNLS
jgi:hypothetical protein